MKVLARPVRTRSIARFVGLVRHSSRAAAAMALRFPVYPPARYAGESEPVKRPKVHIELGWGLLISLVVVLMVTVISVV
jgi:hypothetical protein